MIDLYLMPTQSLLILFFIGISAFLVECVYLSSILSNYRLRRSRVIFGEFMLLVYIGCLAVSPIAFYAYKLHGIVLTEPAQFVLTVMGAFIILHYILTIKIRGLKELVPIAAIIISHPFLPNILSAHYCIFWLFSVVIFAVRGGWHILREFHKQRSELSSISIQEGLDSLPAGLLFCGTDGYIYLVNAKMTELMQRFLGVEHRNGMHMWQDIADGEIIGGSCQPMEGDILIRTESDAWYFSRRSFKINGIRHFEITAIDVTENMVALRRLEEESDLLLLQTFETERLAKTMEDLRREQEYLRMHSQVHDILGQRLTAMQRLSQSGNLTDYSELLTHSRDAMRLIKERRQENADLLFAEIVEYFDNIGLKIELDPHLPHENSIAFLLLSVLREACTNAIRHADATRVFVTIKEIGDSYRIEIRNNGARPEHGMVEGGGLFGIRNRVEGIGGTLKVEVIPEFSLVMNLPRA